jgi:DnaJ-class molecular chaperone
MQWHPDKFQDEEDKKTAEKKFMDIAAAKEVLLDEGTYVRTSVKHFSFSG